MQFTFTDHSDEVKKALQEAIERALERCGSQAEGYAKDLAPVDTGQLRNSITHKVVPSEQAVYIGTNAEHGPYQEFGTGIYYPGGRPTPWNYQDERGNWHRTRGQKAQPFLRPAVADHAQTYKNIIDNEMRRD